MRLQCEFALARHTEIYLEFQSQCLDRITDRTIFQSRIPVDAEKEDTQLKASRYSCYIIYNNINMLIIRTSYL